MIELNTPRNSAGEDAGHSGSAVSYSYVINIMNILKVEIDPFNGDPMKYLTFMSLFDEMVDSKIPDPRVKLMRPLQYTSGIAKASINNCALIGGEAGYDEARRILKGRFGDTHSISQRIISILKSGKPAHKACDVQQLADELAMACTALKQERIYGEFDSQQSIVDILKRCHVQVRNRWRQKGTWV